MIFKINRTYFFSFIFHSTSLAGWKSNLFIPAFSDQQALTPIHEA